MIPMPAISTNGTYPAAEAMRTMMARKIIAARNAVGLTQAALARKAGIRIETLNRLEKGKHTSDLATMAKINKALDDAGAPEQFEKSPAAGIHSTTPAQYPADRS